MSTPQIMDSTQKLYCHSCTKNLVDTIRPYKDEIPDGLEVPKPNLAYSMVVAMVQGMPVSLPVCLRHFMDMTAGSGLLAP